MTSAMQGLGMVGGRFEISLHRIDATHAGRTRRSCLPCRRPRRQHAAPGRQGRLWAASFRALRWPSPSPPASWAAAGTLIFDEVDAGVGGAVAENRRPPDEATWPDRQVLAVTHLAQVAACADHHLVVAKHSESGIAASSVSPVLGETRVREMARMLGGETSLGHHAGARPRDA